MPHAYETQLAADYPLGHRDFTGVVHHHQRQTIGHRADLAHPAELFGGGDCGARQRLGWLGFQAQPQSEHQSQHA